MISEFSARTPQCRGSLLCGGGAEEGFLTHHAGEGILTLYDSAKYKKQIPVFIVTAFFVFGLIIGSFLNAVLWRMKEGMSLGGRSMCPSCRATISWYDNIPLLSYLFLGGKCRACRAVISVRYPLVEATTGILFALLGSAFFSMGRVDSWVETVFFLGVASILLLIFFFDLETMEIPNILLWIGIGWTLPFLLILDTVRFQPGISVWSLSLHSGMVAGLVGFLPLFLMAALSRETWMGMGDGFLAFLLGLVVGWPAIVPALVMAFGLGAGFGLILIALKKKGMRSQIPLGPFLIAGALLALLLPVWIPGVFDRFLWYW